jgi:hypothetical protein
MQPGQAGRLTHCPDNGLPLGQGQARTLMLGQRFAWPPQLRKHVVVLLQTSEPDGISLVLLVFVVICMGVTRTTS